MSAIELTAIGKSFGARTVIDKLSLQVQSAERLVLFGPSGSGKTTILRLIAGLETPDTGEIQINGRVVTGHGKILVPPEERRVGMVFQDLALWPHMSVRANLMFPLKSRGVARAEAESRIADMLSRVGLETRLDAKPHQLSGGEQQRVALARALVSRPPILLMDEPLSSLDEERKRKILTDLLNLHSHLGFTLIYVTHNREESERIASRVVTVMDGRII
jgi:iron(III) transport system ATP-binding protein